MYLFHPNWCSNRGNEINFCFEIKILILIHIMIVHNKIKMFHLYRRVYQNYIENSYHNGRRYQFCSHSQSTYRQTQYSVIFALVLCSMTSLTPYHCSGPEEKHKRPQFHIQIEIYQQLLINVYINKHFS